MTRWCLGLALACAALVACEAHTAVIAVAGSTPAPAGRLAALDSSVPWQCPFPPQAAAVGTPGGVVTLRASVRADGTAESVTIVTDPGDGFGNAAQRCAMTAKFLPALDEHGIAAPGTTKPFQVRFTLSGE